MVAVLVHPEQMVPTVNRVSKNKKLLRSKIQEAVYH